MEIRHLNYFKTLAEELHFGKAAERLYISQPPLSRQIKDLEDELGVILFLRNNKRVQLTEAGKYFLGQVNDIIQNLEHTKNITKQIHENVSGTFKLGYISSTPKTILSNVLKRIEKQYPYLHVHLFETSSQAQKLALEKGELDLGIVRAPIYSNQLEMYTLMEDSICIVAPTNFIFNKSNLSHANYICFNQQYAPQYYDLVVQTCNKLGFDPKIAHQSNSMHSILELVSNGLGIAVAPRSVIQTMKHLKIHTKEINKKLASTQTVLAFHRENRNAALQDFVQYFMDVHR
ncbi:MULTISPECIES: LysR family transcriptional regulator [Chitinophagaceae]